ncbi:MAG: hypothetical protein ABI601_01205 [bacterium]
MEVRGRLVARALGRVGVVCLLVIGACTTRQTPPPQTTVDLNSDGQTSNGKTKVRVENQNSADMTIYVYRGSQRMRLGRAAGNTTTSLDIPSSMVSGVTDLRFQAEPLGNQRGIISQPIPVSPGDLVDFIVPAH